MLEILMGADGAVVSAEDLLERAWDEHADPFTATVRVTDRPAAPQARRPAADRDRRRRGVPAVRPRWKHPSIRLRLTLVYAVVLVGDLRRAPRAQLRAALQQPLRPDRPGPAATRRPPSRRAVRRNRPDDHRRASCDQLSRPADGTGCAPTRCCNTAGTSAIALAVTAVAGLGVSWLVAGRMLRPLRTLTAATRRISQDRLHERIALDRPARRAQGAGRHLRRDGGPAGSLLRQPAQVRRRRRHTSCAPRWRSSVPAPRCSWPSGSTTPEQWEAMARRMLTATGRAERMLDGLLALARSDSGVIAGEPLRPGGRGGRGAERGGRRGRARRSDRRPPTCARPRSTATRCCWTAW